MSGLPTPPILSIRCDCTSWCRRFNLAASATSSSSESVVHAGFRQRIRGLGAMQPRRTQMRDKVISAAALTFVLVSASAAFAQTNKYDLTAGGGDHMYSYGAVTSQPSP